MKKAVRGEFDQPVVEPPDGSKFRLQDIDEPPPESAAKSPQKTKTTPVQGGKTDWPVVDAANRKLGDKARGSSLSSKSGA